MVWELLAGIQRSQRVKINEYALPGIRKYSGRISRWNIFFSMRFLGRLEYIIKIFGFIPQVSYGS